MRFFRKPPPPPEPPATLQLSPLALTRLGELHALVAGQVINAMTPEIWDILNDPDLHKLDARTHLSIELKWTKRIEVKL